MRMCHRSHDIVLFARFARCVFLPLEIGRIPVTEFVVVDTSPYATSFRRRFFTNHCTVKHPHTSSILSGFSIPLFLKCATKILKIGLQIKL